MSYLSVCPSIRELVRALNEIDQNVMMSRLSDQSRGHNLNFIGVEKEY